MVTITGVVAHPGPTVASGMPSCPGTTHHSNPASAPAPAATAPHVVSRRTGSGSRARNLMTVLGSPNVPIRPAYVTALITVVVVPTSLAEKYLAAMVQNMKPSPAPRMLLTIRKVELRYRLSLATPDTTRRSADRSSASIRTVLSSDIVHHLWSSPATRLRDDLRVEAAQRPGDCR